MASQAIVDDSGEVVTGSDQPAGDNQPVMSHADCQVSSVDQESDEVDFSKKTWREDMVLIVEGKKLYVASAILSFMSPVFTSMFEEQFGKEGPREVELKEKNVDDVVLLLRCLYPNITQSVTKENVFSVIPLAHEFEVTILMKACEELLVGNTSASTPPNDVCKYLQFASRFKMETLMDKCLTIAAEIEKEVFFAAEKIHTLSRETTAEVQSRRIDVLSAKVDEQRLIIQKKEEDCRNLKKWLIYGLPKERASFAQAEAGVIKLTIPNVSSFKNSLSDKQLIHGITWRVSASRNKTDDFAIYLQARAPSAWYRWTCEVFVKMMLINQKIGKHYYTNEEDFTHTFSCASYSYGYPSFISMTKLTTGEMYVVDDKAEFTVCIFVKQPACMPDPNLSNE